MEKQLRIDLIVDDSQAKRANKAQVIGLESMIVKAVNFSNAIEKAHKKAADAAAKEAKRGADASAAASAKSLAAAQKAAKDAADAYEKAAQRGVDADLKALARRAEVSSRAAQRAVANADKAAAAQLKATERVTQAETDRVAKLDMLGRQHLSKEEITLRARAQANQKFQQRRIDDAANALGTEKKGWLSLGGAIGGVGKAVLAAGAAILTLETGKSIIFGISDAWAASRKDIENSVLRLSDYEKKLLELADLKNKMGRTTPVLAETLGLRAQTTQTADDAIKYQEGLMNAGAIAIKGGLISDKKGPKGEASEFDKLTVAGGKLQATKGVSAEVMGNFLGAMPAVFGEQGQKAEAIVPEAMNIQRILQLGKSSAASGMAQFQNALGHVTTGVYGTDKHQGARTAAATQAFFSNYGADSAGEHSDQFVRATTGALDMKTRGRVEGGEAVGPFLESIGAKQGMTPNEIGAKISEAYRAARAKNPTLSMDDFTKHHGWGNQEDRNRLAEYSGGLENGQVGTFLKEASGTKIPTFDDAMKDAENSIRTDPTARTRITEFTKDAAETARGVGAPAMLMEARKQAFYRLKGTGKTYGEFDPSNESNLYRGQLDDEVQREVFARAQKLKIDTSAYGQVNAPMGLTGASNALFGTGVNFGLLGGHPMSRVAWSENTRQSMYAELESKIGAAGGGGIDNKSLVDVMERNIKATEKLQDTILSGQKNNQPAGPKAPPPLGAGPPGGMRRPNAGP